MKKLVLKWEYILVTSRLRKTETGLGKNSQPNFSLLFNIFKNGFKLTVKMLGFH